MQTPTVCIIMAGGKGERFWPASRSSLPKQFLRIGGPHTLFQQAVTRAVPLCGIDRIYPVTGADYADLVHEQVPNLPPANIIIEPTARDTAACLALAAFEIRVRFPAADPIMVVLPSDHVITEIDAFVRAVRTATTVAEHEECVVTFGIPPTDPATGYGYIHLGAPMDEGFEPPVYDVKGFREKPNLETAQDYLASGEYLWNSGIFVWRVSVFLDLLAKYLPGHYERLATLYLSGHPKSEELAGVFASLRRISIDYGILEKTTRVKAILARIGWDDLGNWSSIAAHLPCLGHNAVSGDATLIDTEECIVYADCGHVATVGIHDMIVVRVGETVLICPKSRAQDVRLVVEALRRKGRADLI